jgi:Raf kinase inhibitor-like YbhB/YbcL family protein
VSLRRWLLLVALAAVAVGCSDDGRELAEPDPDLTATLVPTTAAPSADAGEVSAISTGTGGFALSSSRIQPGKVIPTRFTCAGEDVSPPLSFTAVPEGTAQLAVVLTDLDSVDRVHWAVRGIPADTTRLAAGELPPDAVEMTNGFGVADYRGPCPPRGEVHRYSFTAYALDANAVELPINDQGVVAVDEITALTAASFLGEVTGSGEGGDLVAGANGFTVSSPDVPPGGEFPERYTCAGDDVSPPLAFAEVPPDTAAIGVALTDEETGALHWVVTGIPFGTTEVAADDVPEEATVVANDFDDAAYAGPCPEPGEERRYRVTAYALGAEPAVEGPNGADVVNAFRTNAITTASFSATASG